MSIPHADPGGDPPPARRTAVDTSVVIPALLGWHEHHARALHSMAEASRLGVLVLPATVLVEAYSVMTRLPPRLRVRPADARRLLSSAFRDRQDKVEVCVVGLNAEQAWEVVDRATSSGHAGGAAHDLAILVAARAAGATSLLTLNTRDFLRFGQTALDVVEP